MGQKKKRGRGGGSKQRTDEWKYQILEESEMKCDRLDRFYAHQKEVLKEGEYEEILQCFKKQLPITFRVNESNEEEAAETIASIKAIQNKMRTGGVPEEKMLHEVEWFPGSGKCWEAKMTKKDLSKTEPGAKPLHEFLIAQTQRGRVSRQEVVSMIPPLFLDVKPHHLVLDTCAAPGSKTAQIMEALARTQPGEDITGCVVANDMDPKRCEVLVKQTQRLREVYPHTIITNHNAAIFPMPVVPSGQELQKVQFDRILADVVCSGDGTFRKSVDLWGRWNALMGCNAHKPQVQILLRSMDLVKEGGRIVYSTCSLNPVEDEAVLNHCLKTTKHEFELVDCSDMLPDLKRSPGVNKWVVTDKDGCQAYSALAEVPEELIKKFHYTESMFPSDDVEKYHLERSMRFKPHLHDTGGFFVAVLTKKKEAHADNVQKVVKVPTDGTAWLDIVKNGKASKKALEFSLFGMQKEEAEPVRQDLRLKEAFPTDRLFCRRTGGKVRRAYLFSPLAANILQGANLKHSGADGAWPNLKIVAGGLRVAEKNSGLHGKYRATQEAAALLAGWCDSDGVVHVSRPAFAALLRAVKTPWEIPLRSPEELASPDVLPGCVPLDEERALAALPNRSIILALKNGGSQTVAGAANKFKNSVVLWADLDEVNRLRLLLGLPIPEKPGKEPEGEGTDEVGRGERAEGEEDEASPPVKKQKEEEGGDN